MGDTAIEATLRRDRAIVATSLAALTAMAWGYLLWLVGTMGVGGMEMHGTRMDADSFGVAMIPLLQPWSAAEFVLMFVMWTIMMVGMMTPTFAPVILVYARVGRQAVMQGKPLAATGYFVGGYLFAWIGFSLFATVVQWALERAALLTPTMASAASTFLGGLALVIAGLFQWTPMKDICLKHCQAPLMFIQRHGGFRSDPLGSLSVGFHHGLYCVGCCWALMTLLFVGGIMNVLWIAGISIFVLAEKLIPSGRVISRIAGTVLTGGGIWVIAAAVW